MDTLMGDRDALLAYLLASLTEREPHCAAPPWYPFLKEAQYLHCPPWEMAWNGDPLSWRTIAFWRLAGSVARDCEKHARRAVTGRSSNPAL